MLEVNQTNTATNMRLAHDCIRELKIKYPNYSSTQIAKEIGMTQSTFSRIENGQTNPSLNSISKLLASLGKAHQLTDAIKISNPQLAETIKQNFSHNIDTPIMGGEYAKYFSHHEYRKILLLALTRSGTTRDEIADQYGKNGIQILSELLKAQILNEVRGIIKANEDKVSFDQEILQDSLINCIKDNYNADTFGQNKNWLSFQTESVNKEKAMSAINEKLKKAYQEIKEEILYSPEYYGNDKVFVGMVADSLLKESPDDSEVIQ